MSKIFLAFFLLPLLINISCFSKNKNGKAEIQNQVAKSINHANIPGTHVYIIPPGGFKPSTGSMKGFIKDEATTFLSVSEFKNHSFESEIQKNSAEKNRLFSSE